MQGPASAAGGCVHRSWERSAVTSTGPARVGSSTRLLQRRGRLHCGIQPETSGSGPFHPTCCPFFPSCRPAVCPRSPQGPHVMFPFWSRNKSHPPPLRYSARGRIAGLGFSYGRRCEPLLSSLAGNTTPSHEALQLGSASARVASHNLATTNLAQPSLPICTGALGRPPVQDVAMHT